MKTFEKVVLGLLMAGAVGTLIYMYVKTKKSSQEYAQASVNTCDGCPLARNVSIPQPLSPPTEVPKGYWKGPCCGWWPSTGDRVEGGSPCDCSKTKSPSL